MAASSEILEILSVFGRSSDVPPPVWREVQADDAPARLRKVVAALASAILPRVIILTAGDAGCTLTVSSGRVIRFSASGDSAPDGQADDTGRVQRLIRISQTLARLAEGDQPLMMSRRYLSGDVSAEDVGFSASEILAWLEETAWTGVPAPVTSNYAGESAALLNALIPVTRGQSVLAADGQPVPDAGRPDLGLSAETAATLTAGVAEMDKALMALAGPTYMLMVPGDAKASLFAVTRSDRLLAEADATTLSSLSANWQAFRGQGGKG